jgi:regulator of replication initiation timing
MRGMRDLKNEVNLARYGVTQDDKLLMMESQIAELTTRQERLAEDNAKLKAENAELRAEPARVVHSSEAA